MRGEVDSDGLARERGGLRVALGAVPADEHVPEHRGRPRAIGLDERTDAEDPKRGAGNTGELDARTVARAKAAASEARALKIVVCVCRRAAARGRVVP